MQEQTAEARGWGDEWNQDARCEIHKKSVKSFVFFFNEEKCLCYLRRLLLQNHDSWEKECGLGS